MAQTLLLAAPPPALLLMAVLLVAAMATDNTDVSQLTSKNTAETATAPPPPSSSSSPASSSTSSSSSSSTPSSSTSTPSSTPSSSSSSSSSSTSSSSSSSTPSSSTSTPSSSSSTPSSSASSSSSSTSSSTSLSSPPPPSLSDQSSSSSTPSSSVSPPPPLVSDEKTQVTPAAETPANKKGFYKGMSREFVNEHNKVRARYGAGPLTWDKTLALYARRWANLIQADCDKARHSDKKMYGECFFLGTNGTAQDALCSWEKEEEIYDRGTTQCTPGHNMKDCGHFAIMVNKQWKWVGCGRAPCTQGPRQGQYFISCSYTGEKPNNTVAASTP